MTAGFVYLLGEFNGSHYTGLCKIGRTTQANAEIRKKQYQAGNARPLVLLHEERVSNCEEVEKKLHAYWKARGKHCDIPGGGTEWFYLSQEDVAITIQTMKEYSYTLIPVATARPSEPIYQSETDYSYQSDHFDEFDLPWGWIFAGLAVFIIAVAGGNSAMQERRAISDSMTIGNPYALKCRPGYGGVNLRASPSLTAPVKAELACHSTVILMGEAMRTDEYWYPVKTPDGVPGFVAKVAIDP